MPWQTCWFGVSWYGHPKRRDRIAFGTMLKVSADVRGGSQDVVMDYE